MVIANHNPCFMYDLGINSHLIQPTYKTYVTNTQATQPKGKS